MPDIQVTTMEDLKTYAKGQLVELPPFADGMPLNAYMRRPSMLVMMKGGKIPNKLLSTANALFNGTTTEASKEDDEIYKEVLEISELLAEASLINPSLQAIKSAGLELTDDQYTFIFQYSQRGVKALETFRQESADSKDTGPSQGV